MRIQHNISAMNSYRQMGGNNNALSKNLEKLSSGYRINRAGDDAAGLAISEKMRAQIKGLETAQKNANDGISLIQTAEGALTEVHSMLNRMTELATQSANGTYENEVDRENLQAEVDALLSEIDRISQSTNFNGINLLDGSLGGEAAAAVTDAGEGTQVVMNSSTTNITGTYTHGTQSNFVSTAAITAVTNGAVDITTEVVYKDAQGQDKKLSVTTNIGGAAAKEAVASALAESLNADEEFSSMFTASIDSNSKLVIQSKETGATAPKITTVGHTSSVTANFANVTAEAGGTNAAGTDATQTIAIGTNPKAGDTLEVGDKVYEFVAAADDAVKTEGAVAVVIGGTTTATGANLEAALKANGVSSAVNAAGTITISDVSEITAAQKGVQVTDVDSAFSVTGQEAKAGKYEFSLAASATSGDFSFTVEYLDENNEMKTATVDYTAGASEDITAENIKEALKENGDLTNLFDISTDAAGKITFEAKTTGSDGARLISAKSSDTAATVGAISTTKPQDAGKVLELKAGTALEEGDSITVGGKTYEFVLSEETAPAKGNTAIVIEKKTDGTVDMNKTMENLAKALEEDGVAIQHEGAKITFMDDKATEAAQQATGGGLKLQIGDTADDFNQLTVSVGDMSTKGLGIEGLSIADPDAARAAVDKIKDAINTVSSTRGDLGAIQNRLEHTINNLGVTTENITAAESRIRDTDMASEMMQYTKNNILIQASQAMLAQANQVPQGVLQLLQ